MSEWESAGRIAGAGLGAVVDVVAATHDSIAHRVEQALPPVASEVAGLHRSHAARVYRRVGVAHRWIPALLGHLGSAHGTPVSGSRTGRAVLPVINGMWGDHLAGAGEPLAIRMELCDPPQERAPHLVFFVHGLFEDERAWQNEQGSFGRRLERDLGVTSLHVRYNSGIRISENGAHLRDLIDAVVAESEVEEITLVGHSMGGLVCRSAAQDARWLPQLKRVVTIGTPHLGSPVEKAVHVGDWALRRFPQTRAIGDFVARRSVGIKDLRFGAVVTEDWEGHDPDAFLRNTCTDACLPDHVSVHWVAATVLRNRCCERHRPRSLRRRNHV